MKKLISGIILFLLIICLSACTTEMSADNHTNSPEETSACTEHVIEIINGYQPECTEEGLSDGEICSVCGKILKEQTVIPPTGHDIIDGICQRCGKKFVSLGIDLELSENGKFYIVSGTPGSTTEEIIIPDEYEGKPVEEIKAGAFSDNISIKRVFIPRSVRKTGADAFSGCISLEEVYIDGLEEWCSVIFENERSNPLFYAGRLFVNEKEIKNELYIPEGVQEIKKYSFEGLKSIGILRLGYGVENIEEYAFSDCTVLSTVDVAKTVNHIDENAFYGCTMLRNIDIHDLGDWLRFDHRFPSWYDLYYNDVLLETLIIPDDIQEIRSFAFENCRSLKKVICGENVKFIGEYAFFGCKKLERIDFDAELLMLGRSSFENCTSLVSADMYQAVNTIGEAAFRNCSALVSMALPESTVIIPEYVFENCASLTGASISLSAEKIGEGAFRNCICLRDFYLPESVSEIGKEAFCYCESLSEAVIPENVKVIEENAYFGSGITLLETGGAEEIRMNAFARCKKLETVIIGKELKTLSDAPFNADTGIRSVIISDIDKWCALEIDCEESNPLRYGAELYIGDEKITDLIIPGNIKTIKDYVFCGAGSLKSITINDGASEIGNGAFSGCRSLEQVKLPANLTTVGENILADCTSLKTVLCAAKSKPEGWSGNWADGNKATIKWNSK